MDFYLCERVSSFTKHKEDIPSHQRSQWDIFSRCLKVLFILLKDLQRGMTRGRVPLDDDHAPLLAAVFSRILCIRFIHVVIWFGNHHASPAFINQLVNL